MKKPILTVFNKTVLKHGGDKDSHRALGQPMVEETAKRVK